MGDFGLAEDVYSTGYFRQNDSEKVKLPYKWLALESLNDAIFNEKTDVVRCNALNRFYVTLCDALDFGHRNLILYICLTLLVYCVHACPQ